MSTTADHLITKSTLPKVDIPDTSIPEFFFKCLWKHTKLVDESNPRPLFVSGTCADEFLTARQVETLSRQLAAGLYTKVGVRKGDVVAVILPNSIYYTVVVLGVLMLGASCTLANPVGTVRELVYQLKDSDSKFIITTTGIKDAVDKAVAEVGPRIRKTLFIEREGDEVTGNKSSVFDVLCTEADSSNSNSNTGDTWDQAATTIDPDSVAIIPYSSGTTGYPKGVVLTHRNIVANILQVTMLQTYDGPDPSSSSSSSTSLSSMANSAKGAEIRESSKRGATVAVLPMYHSFGLLFLCFQAPSRGITTVVMAKFEMQGFLQLVERHRVTEAILVPPIVSGLAKMPEEALYKHDLSSLRSVLVGAAPLCKDTIAAVEKRLPRVRVFQGYGLTETSPAVSLNRYEDPVAGSSGRLLPNIDAKVVDDEGNAVDAGSRGELCFRGPNVMAGYLNRETETSECIDCDGFFHTGDIGYIDEQQHVYLTDRKKELIKYNGFQVAPAELEGIMLQHPSVRDCAVAGVYDARRQTEVPRAYIVLCSPLGADEKIDSGDGSENVAEEVVAWTNSQVAYYKHLRGGYVLLEAIPKSASGKILRRVLKEKHGDECACPGGSIGSEMK
ncbi:hypothetical protein LPJ72_003964 [Coemansia sp. Benny D160-2]|nr:hypothetical protein LPJ72_003964 [Coemansia sp. Benny D160-2]